MATKIRFSNKNEMSDDSKLSPTLDTKRKVSILTDPPKVQGYDNPAFDGPLRDGSVS